MRKKIILTLIFFSWSILFPFQPVSATEDIKVLKLVLFKNTVDLELIHETNSIIIEDYKNLPAAKIEIPFNQLSKYYSASTVLSIENEQFIEATGQVIDWSVSTVQSERAWQANYTGKHIKVAILDSGIASHPDLKIAGGASFVSYTTSFSDDNGHGTHVAGIIAALNNDIGTVGVSPDAQIYAAKVLDSNGNGYLTDIIGAIDWAITNEMDIINLSLGSLEHSPLLEYSINRAYNSGALIVAAGGNEGNTEGIGENVAYPAKYNSVIAVSAVDQQIKRASFSATGNEIEYTAPGVAVLSTYLNNSFARLSGTSMSTGFVTGSLALLKEMYPTMSNNELAQQLKKTALDLGTPGKDPWFGFGLIQSPQSPERIAGKDRFEVAVNISRKGWQSSGIVMISNNNAFADALSAAPLAYQKDAPLLLTGSASLHPLTREEILRLGAREIILVGGRGSISENIDVELRNMGINVRRIDGKNRFEVSRNIAYELGNFPTAIVVNGLNYPDALAIAPYASQNGFPILLTSPHYLPSETTDVIQNKLPINTIVVGGEASVSNNVFIQLPKPIRIGGKDRYEVASTIFREFFPSTTNVYYATGSTFADALTGSVLISKEKTSLLLTQKENLPDSVLSILAARKIDKHIILGGVGSVDNRVISALTN